MTPVSLAMLRRFTTDNAPKLAEELQRFELNVEALGKAVKLALQRPWERRAQPITANGEAAYPGHATYVDTSAASIELFLPQAERAAEREFLIVKTVAANSLTLRPVTGSINGAAAKVVTAAGATRVYCDGSDYWA